MNTRECLNDIIGLAETDCQCYGDPPADYDISKSGYFITKGQSGIPIDFVKASEGCEVNLWDILEDARIDGVTKFLSDLGKMMGRKKYTDFDGWIGEKKITGERKAKKYAGWLFTPFVSSTVEISELSIYVNGSTTVQLLDENDDDVLSVDVTGTGWTTVPFDVCFSLSDNYYCLVYEVPDGAKLPKNNLFSCNCSFSKKKLKHDFLNFFDLTPFNIDELDDNIKNCGNYSNGLRIKACVSCDISEFLCNLDFNKSSFPSIAHDVALTIKLAAIMCLGERLLVTPSCSPYLMMAHESLPDHLKIAEGDYKNNIAWLAKNLPSDLLRCFECKGISSKKSII